MSQQIEALKLALEALEWADCNDDDSYEDKKQKALTAIYQALADADAFTCRMRVGQDSVTWYDEKGNETMHIDSSNKVTVTKHESTNEPVKNSIQFMQSDGITQTWVMCITQDKRIEVNDGVEVDAIAKKVLEAMQYMLNAQDQKKDEALRLALEALKLEDLACRYEKFETPEHIAKAITLIEQALENK